MNWAAFPYLRIALMFSSGIFAYEYFDFGLSYALIPLFIFSFFYFIGEFYIKIQWPKSAIQGLLLLISIFFAGGVTINLKKESLTKNIIVTDSEKYVVVCGTVTEKLKSSKGTKLLTKISAVAVASDSFASKDPEIILLFGAKDTIASQYKAGDGLLLKVKLSYITKNTNPEAFDYAYYLKTKGILQQGFVHIGQHKKIEQLKQNRVIKLAGKSSDYADGVLAKYIKDPETLGIAEAILLGQKLLLSDEIYKSYTNTGAIHVLSVSGLHVAIFISVFIWLFSLSKRQDTFWKISKIVILLIIVWFYVILTGMSPSVVRAGVMVSLYIVGSTVFKSTNSYNILSIAAIVMLMYDPYYLFQVSFQFSFISLLSILYFHPKISSWWIPENKIFKFVWDLINVSIAAQIFIFPVTIFYFHQFPVYFAISGIIAVPLVTIIIYLGTLSILAEGIFAGFNNILGPLLTGLIKILNYSIHQISQWPYSIISDIWISDLALALMLLSILIFIIWYETRVIQYFYLILIVILLIFGEYIYRSSLLNSNSCLFVYNTRGMTLIDFMSGKQLYSMVSGVSNDKSIAFAAENNRLQNGIQNDSPVKYLAYLFQIDSQMIYINNPLEDPKYIRAKKLEILIVTKNKYNTPEQLLSTFDPKIVVLDGNLPLWIEEKWLSLRDKSGFMIHNIKTDGSFHYYFTHEKL